LNINYVTIKKKFTCSYS